MKKLVSFLILQLVSNLISGIYTVILRCDGIPKDVKSLIIE